MNLLSNSLKFTNEGHIKVSIELDEDCQTLSRVSVPLSDRRFSVTIKNFIHQEIKEPRNHISTLKKESKQLKITIEDTGVGI